MSDKFKLNFLNTLKKINRAGYILFLATILFVWGAGLKLSTALAIYYLAIYVIMFAVDELILKKKRNKFPFLLFQIRLFAYTLLVCIGTIIGKIPVVLTISLLCFILVLLIEDLYLSDVFNTFFNYIKRIIIGLVVCICFIFIQRGGEVEGAWILLYFIVTIIVVSSIFLAYELFYRAILSLDDRYTKLYFKNADMIEENKKLIKFQERVEKVNSEINYQKINLTKAIDDLAKINEESRSLIEVMKYFSASFDVEKNAEIMVNNVVDIKKTGTVALYMEKDVYMNDEPYLHINSSNPVTEELLKKDILNIYNAIHRRESFTPLVLCDNYDFKYPYLTGGNICNAVAFPAYENDRIYGVMVVTSSKYDFFENGFSFYESSIMDFTSALISDRLYLKTEDMAKKDGLTKIYNRIYFNQFYPELKSEIEQEENGILTVAMLDIDHFKNVNDTYGHLAGDEAIKSVARVDDKYAKLHNGTAVRFGGEEFLLILRGKGLMETYEILKQMHEEIRTNIVEFEDLKISINTSMGLASYPETCSNIHEIVDRADQAMYYSKEHGRGRITIDGREGEDVQ
ncbi:MAG: GGDEF domain-containing protein [Eubacterium sp.]|nr:GGDEF domain-containing protein [Eubacterium sp.]